MKLPDPNEELPEENPQPKYETKRVVYRSKAVPKSRNAGRKLGSFFGQRSTAKPEESAPSQPVPPAVHPRRPPPTGSMVPSRSALSGEEINPGMKLRSVEAAGRYVPPDLPVVTQTPQASPTGRKPGMGFVAKFMTLFDKNRKQTRPNGSGKEAQAGTRAGTSEAFFDEGFFALRAPELRKSLRAGRKLGGILSLVINAILLGVILVLMARMNALSSTLNNVLGGLYENFVFMDNSTIATTIYVEDMPIPLDFSLPVVQDETNVILTRAVTIYGARVTINSGALTIDNAPATVTLPAGTNLPVSLNMSVPVQTTVLMDLQVPININLSQSNPPGDGQVGLHDAFLGLQNTIGPFYCLFKQDLLNASGGLVCQQGSYSPQIINP
jgi:hypothetical protein